jgi:hypothetical protein
MEGWDSQRVWVEFESEGAALRGFLYKAVKGEPPFQHRSLHARTCVLLI